MKSLRIMLPLAALIAIATLALANSAAPKTTDQTAPSAAQKSFDALKGLAGNWKGPVTVFPPQPDWKGNPLMQVTMRVTSRGNALVHELQEAGTPLDPTKYDHPVTMFYVDSGHLTLVHYCDAGNRPRMVAHTSPDGKTIAFDFVDMSGGDQYGHMGHAVFTMIDANHHTENWTYIMPGNKPVRAHMDLRRTQ
jgi:hypothetical protein